MAQENVPLRLESEDGSPSEEYRLANGRVEVRSLQSHENSWYRLTPQQLSTHVERHTVVAQWLKLRLGWRRLLQACVGQEPQDWTTTQGWTPADDYVEAVLPFASSFTP